MNMEPLLKHLEDVRDIYENISETKGEVWLDAVRFAGTVSSLDRVIGFIAVNAFDSEEQIDAFEHIVKDTMANLVDMYFEAAGIAEDQIDDVLNTAKLLQDRAENAARQVAKS